MGFSAQVRVSWYIVLQSLFHYAAFPYKFEVLSCNYLLSLAEVCPGCSNGNCVSHLHNIKNFQGIDIFAQRENYPLTQFKLYIAFYHLSAHHFGLTAAASLFCSNLAALINLVSSCSRQLFSGNKWSGAFSSQSARYFPQELVETKSEITGKWIYWRTLTKWLFTNKLSITTLPCYRISVLC